MCKTLVQLLSTVCLFCAITANASEQVFLVCKAPSSGMAGRGGCINAYKPTPDKVCSGKGQETCSTDSLEDLCIKVGQKVGIPFNRFSSGLGTFKTEAECLSECNKEYGGRFERFGGKCFGTLSK